MSKYYHVANEIVVYQLYLVGKDGNDEVVEGKSLREVGVVKVEKEQSKYEDKELSGQLCVRTAY